MSVAATALSPSGTLTKPLNTSATIPPRFWTPDEEKRLEYMRAKQGLFVSEIAPMLKRSHYSVRAKIAAMGLERPDNWSMKRGFTLAADKQVALRRHWLNSVPVERAARLVGTSEGTAARFYHECSESVREAAESPRIGTYIGLKEMMAIVAPICGVPASAITGPLRIKPNVCARMAIARAMRDRGVSLPHIARMLGRRDHTTVMHYMRNFERYVLTYPEIRRAYEAIKQAEARAAERLAA